MRGLWADLFEATWQGVGWIFGISDGWRVSGMAICYTRPPVGCLCWMYDLMRRMRYFGWNVCCVRLAIRRFDSLAAKAYLVVPHVVLLSSVARSFRYTFVGGYSGGQVQIHATRKISSHIANHTTPSPMPPNANHQSTIHAV